MVNIAIKGDHTRVRANTTTLLDIDEFHGIVD